MTMTKNEKELLLKDICTRLPYEVIVGTTDNDGTIPNFWSLDSYNRLTEDVRITNCEVNADRLTYFCDVKPYLFPMSSMTEEQKLEYYGTFSLSGDISGSIDFYNKHHLDWRGLIPMGLAIDATNLNIY